MIRFACCMLAALALLGIGNAGAEPLKIRIAWIVPAGDAPLALLGKTGVARHQGESYTLDFVHFTGTPSMITALAAGEVDLAPLGFPAFALAIENARLDDLRIIADGLGDGVGKSFSNRYMVLKNSAIRRVEDLKGKVVAVNAIGAAVDIGLRAMLKQRGLETNRDYTMVEAAFPNMKAELLEHKVDLISMVPPFAMDPQLDAAARTLFTQKDAMGPTQLLVMTARAGFIDAHRAAVVDFLEDNLRMIAWYLDPAHHAEAIKTVADFTKTPPAMWSSWAFTPADVYRNPTGRPDLEALARNIATAHAVGVLPAAIDPRPYAELSLVEEAAKRLR